MQVHTNITWSSWCVVSDLDTRLSYYVPHPCRDKLLPHWERRGRGQKKIYDQGQREIVGAPIHLIVIIYCNQGHAREIKVVYRSDVTKETDDMNGGKVICQE
jgi:hypothetical protein